MTAEPGGAPTARSVGPAASSGEGDAGARPHTDPPDGPTVDALLGPPRRRRRGRLKMMVSGGVKRIFDFSVAGAGLVATAPVLATVAVLIRLLDGSPVLFSQVRSGRHGKPFVLHKFRTMSTESEDPTTDAARITRLGARLRATSLDELPTLWNVAVGNMSLVGPRPLPERYLERYSRRQLRRLDVRPGVTGLAQVCGRNLLSWEERFELDVAYVERRTLAADLRILARTFRSVAAKEGIEAESAITMPEFTGSADRRPEEEPS